MLFFVNKPEEEFLIESLLSAATRTRPYSWLAMPSVLARLIGKKTGKDGCGRYLRGQKRRGRRNIELSDNCEVVDYDEIVDLLLGSDEKVVSL